VLADGNIHIYLIKQKRCATVKFVLFIYYYIPETKYVSEAYNPNVATILWLQFIIIIIIIIIDSQRFSWFVLLTDQVLIH
jgi:hypothetical protein